MFQRKVCRAFAREFGGIGQSSLDILFLDRRVAAHGFFAGNACRKVVENNGNHHTRATDTRLSVTDRRVDSDALLPVGHAPFYLAVRRYSILEPGGYSRETPFGQALGWLALV